MIGASGQSSDAVHRRAYPHRPRRPTAGAAIRVVGRSAHTVQRRPTVTGRWVGRPTVLVQGVAQVDHLHRSKSASGGFDPILRRRGYPDDRVTARTPATTTPTPTSPRSQPPGLLAGQRYRGLGPRVEDEERPYSRDRRRRRRLIETRPAGHTRHRRRTCEPAHRQQDHPRELIGDEEHLGRSTASGF